MKADLDRDRIWRYGVRLSDKSFRRYGEPELPCMPDCAFTLEAFLSEDFDTDMAIAAIANALATVEG